MSALYEMLNWPVAQRLGWVAVSFLWQGTAVAALLAAALIALRRASANARYLAACAALLLMAACPVATWVWLAANPPAGVDHQAVASPLVALSISPAAVISEGAIGKPQGDLQILDRSAATPALIANPAKTNIAANTFEFPQAQWISLLAAGWVVGVLLLSFRLALGARRVRQLRRQAVRMPAGQLQSTLVRLVDHFRITWPVELAESALVEVPTVIGWIKPIVLLPATAISGLSVEQLEGLLAHEIAHIRRHDYLVNLVQTAIETLLFYHPAVWWVSSCIRQEREHCCDDMAVAVCGNRLAYARSLMTLEELRVAVGPLALAAGGGRLLPRIRRIVGAPPAARCAAGYWLAGILLMALSVSIVVQLTHSAAAAGDEAPRAEAEPPGKAPANDMAPAAAAQPQGHDATPVEAPAKPTDEDSKNAPAAANSDAGVVGNTLPIVEVIHPVVREVYDFQDYHGFVMPMQKVQLRARASGQLAAVKVNSGDLVKQGDLLFQIDDQRYKAELDKAQANLRIAEAILKTAQFEFDKNNQANTAVPGSISKHELDLLKAQSDQGAARFDAASAELQLAKLNLAATRIIAPINGRIGRIDLDAGNMVKADDTVLATISSVDPVYIGFYMDQAALVRLQAAQRAGKFKFADAPVLFRIGEGTDFPDTAKLTGGPIEVDSATGVSLLRAIAPNPHEALIPGLSVEVRLPTGKPFEGLLLPIVYVRPRSTDVYVVNGQGVVESRRIVQRLLFDGMLVVESGLTKEDLVVLGTTAAPILDQKVQIKVVTPETWHGAAAAGPAPRSPLPSEGGKAPY